MDLHSGLPYWIVKNEFFDLYQPLRNHCSIDVAIIGSGITATSFAYNALASEAGLKIAMLEARDVCSGATGRYYMVTEPCEYVDIDADEDDH